MPKAYRGPNLRDFQRRFPTEEACLLHLKVVRFGERHECSHCHREAAYYRVAKRRCFECEHCGHQVYPTAGTPFDKTRTPLRDWFMVMFLFCTTRNGVAAKEVQRQLGVTYKTAWRMCFHIRLYMGQVDGDWQIGGGPGGGNVVEVDKAFIGGRDKRGHEDKSVVLGMIERKGDVITRVIPDRSVDSVVPHIVHWVKEGSTVNSDEARAFADLHREGFEHDTVNHAAKEYVRGDTHTNTIEAFWANVKRGISGTYVWVSKRYLPIYLRELEYRHNLRHEPWMMFDCLLTAFPKARAA